MTDSADAFKFLVNSTEFVNLRLIVAPTGCMYASASSLAIPVETLLSDQEIPGGWRLGELVRHV